MPTKICEEASIGAGLTNSYVRELLDEKNDIFYMVCCDELYKQTFALEILFNIKNV
jgi:hypothetical protein